jgi:hypothetical protein
MVKLPSLNLDNPVGKTFKRVQNGPRRLAPVRLLRTRRPLIATVDTRGAAD